MGTTTKMAIPYPEATGLVKDGWEDMKDIATQVDAKSGLVLLNTTSFSAVASQSINDVFSSSYNHYKILLSYSTSVDSAVYMRLRVSNTDNSSTNYGWARFNYRSGATATVGGYTETAWFAAAGANVRKGNATIDLFEPFTTDYASMTTNSAGANASYSLADVAGGTMSVTTSYTGFTIYPGSGTISGKVIIYGYNL